MCCSISYLFAVASLTVAVAVPAAAVRAQAAAAIAAPTAVAATFVKVELRTSTSQGRGTWTLYDQHRAVLETGQTPDTVAVVIGATPVSLCADVPGVPLEMIMHTPDGFMMATGQCLVVRWTPATTLINAMPGPLVLVRDSLRVVPLSVSPAPAAAPVPH